MITDISETLKAWAAGIFDGEGTITIKKSGSDKSYLQLCVAVCNTDGRMIDIIHDNWGGYLHGKSSKYLSTSNQKTKKTAYNLYFSDYNEVKSLLIDVLPHLKTKQEHARVVLAALLAVGKLEDGRKHRNKGVSNTLMPFYERVRYLDAIIHQPNTIPQKFLDGSPTRRYSK